MKLYFEYLLKNPMKLIYCIFIIVFIVSVGLCQPYKEYKDGLR